jgi:lipopolysaccharide transport system ATP-binding protein
LTDTAIRVENLSKLYHIGKAQKRHDTLRDAIVGAFNVSASEHSNDDTIWALRDVSFEVKRGEVVGIIGRNGAGKSTLLKILSRITEPTRGRAIIDGRVGSLLEVGTGFHPELTGRENIYLNGAILGMKKAEIARKFDEIVAFAEIEKFLDTPVKHYSSGMYVRLAFAVAAHLEPEILLVDEVLAVGDAAFQKKCLGKMGDVAKEGRTVLFVSHNMAAVMALCQTGILLGEGKTMFLGDVKEAVGEYQDSVLDVSTTVDIKHRKDRGGDGSIRIVSVAIASEKGKAITPMSRLKITVGYESQRDLVNPGFLVGVYDANNTGVLFFDSDAVSGISPKLPPLGTVTCITEPIRLTPRRYFVNVLIRKGGQGGSVADHLQQATHFDVVPADLPGIAKLPPPHILFVTSYKWHSNAEESCGDKRT